MFAKIRNLIAVAAIVFVMPMVASCSDEEGAPRMLWEVSFTPKENVYAESYPDYHPGIQIIANDKTGEVTLTSTNYTSLQLVYGGNTTSQAIRDTEMNFTAKVVDGNKIIVTFEPMPETFDTQIETFLKINGSNGTYHNMAAARITRMPRGITPEDGELK